MEGTKVTKAIRIENADTSNHKVRVFVERMDEAGKWVRGEPPQFVDLNTPTQLVQDYVHSGQRLVVEEVA